MKLKTNGAMTATVTGTVIAWTFVDGKKLVVDCAKLPTAIQSFAMVDRIKNKIADTAAIERNPATGASATVAEKFAAMQDMVERLGRGLWNERGESSTAILVAAMVRVSGKTQAKIETYLQGLDATARKKMARNPKIARAILDIEAEAAKAAGVNVDKDLDAIMKL